MNIDRVNSEIRKFVMDLISHEIKDPRVADSNAMISIMRVDTTQDLKYCRIYVSIMGAEDAKNVVEGLNASAGFIRNGLFSRLKIRAVPNLTFILDDSIDYGFKIESILKTLDIKPAEEDSEE